MTPYKHQQEILDLNPSRHGLWHSTGSGKSFLALWLAKARALPVLIITKKDLVKKWERDATAMLTQHAVVLSKEQFKARAATLPTYQTVIIDEAHHHSGMTSGLYKTALTYLRRPGVQNIYLLTATPYRSTPWNVYALSQLLGAEWPYQRFKDRFFTTEQVHYRRCPLVPRCPGCPRCCRTVQVKKDDPDSRETLAKALRTIGSVVRLEDCADIPEQTFRKEEIALSPEQKKLYKEFVEGSPATRAVYRHRIEAGHVYGEGYATDQFLDTAPVIERVRELAFEFPKLTVICKFRLQMEHLKRLLTADGRQVLELHGDVKDRDSIVQQANQASECVLLIQAQCSEGYELQTFPVMVFASQDYSHVASEQIIGRLLRINALKRNLYIYLVPGGVSEEVYQSVQAHKTYDPARYSAK